MQFFGSSEPEKPAEEEYVPPHQREIVQPKFRGPRPVRKDFDNPDIVWLEIPKYTAEDLAYTVSAPSCRCPPPHPDPGRITQA